MSRLGNRELGADWHGGGSSWSIGLLKREMLEAKESRRAGNQCAGYMAYSECYDIINRLCREGNFNYPCD